MAVTDIDKSGRGSVRSHPHSHSDDDDRHGFDGQTVGAILLAGWVWGVFVFLGWGLIHSVHLPFG